MHCFAGQRYRRVDSSASGFVWLRGIEADLRACFALWAGGVCLFVDQVGPFTKDVRDAATLLQVIAGADERDSTNVPEPVPNYAAALSGDVKGLRIGLPREYQVEGLDPEVKAATDAAVKQLEALGAEVKEISLPHTEYACSHLLHCCHR